MSPPRVAIVHERFTELGGSERVVEQLFATWPGATVHTPLLDPSALPLGIPQAAVRTGGLQRLYGGGPAYAHFLALLPGAIERLDLSDADLVITSHHAFANRVRPLPRVPVISYTHTPARWMWDGSMARHELGGPLGRAALAAFARTQRQADADAARRSLVVVVNSRHVADRVWRWWGVASTVVPPPVDVDRLRPSQRGGRDGFFLLAGRLVPYKQPDVAVAAASRAGVHLVVVGEGRMRRRLEALAGPTVDFLGRVDDDVLLDLYQRCRALVFPGEEDFGLVAVEAQACGSPVVAQRVGGVLDTVVDGITGTLYDVYDGCSHVETLATVLRRFRPDNFDPAVIRRHAERFSPEKFRRRMAHVVGEVTSEAHGAP